MRGSLLDPPYSQHTAITVIIFKRNERKIKVIRQQLTIRNEAHKLQYIKWTDVADKEHLKWNRKG